MKKILIVDDQEPIRNALHLLINSRSQGQYQVIEAANGQEALEKFEKEKPNLAVVDLMMPRVDGFTMLNEIKLIDSHVPVIILTAKTDEATANEVKTNYPDYVLITKPADNNFLFDTIKRLVEAWP